ncbi:MAG TPA: DNA-binding protein [Sneathiellales bacterium]|nr:DNA-binding protein [Sneathiellales bacterium]
MKIESKNLQEYISREQLSNLLGVSTRRLNDVLARTEIPAIDLGKGTLRFRRSEVEEILDSRKRIIKSNADPVSA